MASENSSRQGFKWENEEQDNMIRMVKDGYSIESIAMCHRRSTGGIYGRLKRYCQTLIANGDQIDEIIDKTGLSKSTILSIEYNGRPKWNTDSFVSPRNRDLPEPEQYQEQCQEQCQKPKSKKPKSENLGNEKVYSMILELRYEVMSMKKMIEELTVVEED